MFVDWNALDYRLGAGSPCIDAGANAYMPSPSDLNGVPRPLDGDADGRAVVDMGCYELVHAAADSDRDGLRDSEETRTHGTDATATDTDGDNSGDGSEVVADTDPLDSNSVLRVTGIGAGHGVAVIAWQGGVRATQWLEYRTELLSTTEQWAVLFTNPPPTERMATHIDGGGTDRVRFYRVRAGR
jgi:hypothetical protein